MYQSLLTDFDNGILKIVINRPEKLNALNGMVIEELGLVMDKVYSDSDIKAVVITGAGEKAFVAGADISEFIGLSAEQGTALANRGHELVFNKIENCSKPIIAAVNGFALGGGCELAMACHIRLASHNAKFGQPEVNLGLIPGYGGTQRLTQLVGKGKAMELVLTGAIIDATEALNLGLVNYVTTVDGLLAKSVSLLQIILGKAPLALKAAINLINIAAYGSGTGLQQEAEAFGSLFSTYDAKEGAAAFFEKRKPLFKGM